jgi:hypothetical protein
MDFSFGTMKKSALIADDTSNYRLSRNLVLFWENVASMYNALPNAAFKKALSTSATEINAYKWLWSFNFLIGNSEYLGELTAVDTTRNNDSIDWTMTISQVGATTASFKYMTGRSAKNNTGGWWNLYYPNPLNYASCSFLKIEWKKENDNITSLRYTNTIASSENKGSYIEFNQRSNASFDRTFTMKILNYPNNTVLNGKIILIEWNSTNKNGQISIDGTTWGAWNSNFVNIAG